MIENITAKGFKLGRLRLTGNITTSMYDISMFY